MYTSARGSITTLILLFSATVAHAQQTQPQTQAPLPQQRWSVDFSIGFDNSISGNINSSAIGSLNGQTTVILKNKYEDVYGTGLHLRFGGGYMWRENQEFRVSFTLQQLDADLVQLGEYGAATLYGQFDDYESFSMDLGFRQYMPLKDTLRGYAEGTLGLGFISETDVVLAAPQANLVGDATDFYDRTAAFTLGGNVGLMAEVRPKVDVFGQVGLRFVTGMAQPDNLFGSGLEDINDNSSRWAVPFSVGIRVRF